MSQVPHVILNAMCHLHNWGWSFLHGTRNGATSIEAIDGETTLHLCHTHDSPSFSIDGQPATHAAFYRAIERKRANDN
ncbi:hypothetical protein [Glutamicibacter creatinolyticus]|uniref:hypothetical protein n=1 Tax=Glutamicibacter creatinolyticus TaxID=162496 RepID=UPI0032167D97